MKKVYRTARRLLCALLAVLLLPISGIPSTDAQAASTDSPYEDVMNTLVEWGIMQGYTDGSLRPNATLTRAEFVALVNRAYGYTETGDMPFNDVLPTDWFADDISIAYNMGYFYGTTENTASPNSPLTREQAMVLLARNMRMEESTGEITEFDDSRDFGTWSRGFVRAALDKGMIYGYEDGTFRPQNEITRGEMSVMLYHALGNLINESGDHALGDVFGNVTINTAGATLRDSTIAGDLYITGGLGLGGVTLNNVRVLGEIIVAGSGESEGGQDSVALNNVEAQKLTIDNMAGQYLSLSANGDTVIDQTVLRSNAFIDDRTEAGMGLLQLTLEGNDVQVGSYNLAGNIENVVNKAPLSQLQISRGVVKSLTVDEEAAGSSLNIDMNATIRELKLDTAVSVTGQGDIDSATISVNDCTIEMLPDKIDIRPGITAEIHGEKMDSKTGEESNEEPKILAGYPIVRNIAPSTADAVFSTNKSGTIYWAVSAISDGSLDQEELLVTSSYGSKAIANGTVSVTSAATEITAAIKNLTRGGSYYLSAMLKDARGVYSPVKVVSFSTPDDTAPGFATGFPVMSKITKNSAQMNVMVTKDCILYWAVLPKGSAAPTAADFKANAVTGNLGYGMEEVKRNTPYYFTVNQQALEEQKSYDLYVWLSDADGAKSSKVQKISFTTVDGTPPVFNTEMIVTGRQATSLRVLVNVNEKATVYWVIVKSGSVYPTPPPGGSAGNVSDDYAIMQIVNGAGDAVIKNGGVSVSANKDVTFTISGLQGQTEYDIYYVAKDAAGNYSEYKKLTDNTLDNIAPTARQEFDIYPGENKTAPFADTNIDIIFSETVQPVNGSKSFLELYQEVDAAVRSQDAEEIIRTRNNLSNALRDTITLYQVTGTGRPSAVTVRTQNNEDSIGDTWVVDYRYATVSVNTDNNEMTIHLPNTFLTAPQQSALNLRSGSTYYFELRSICDTSSAKNPMGITDLPQFTTSAAQAVLQKLNLDMGIMVDGTRIQADAGFTMTPMSTTRVEDEVNWDLLIWSDTSITYNLYYREADEDETVSDTQNWTKVSNGESLVPGEITIPTGSAHQFNSLWRDLHGDLTNPRLKDLEDNKVYKFAIEIVSISGSTDRPSWSTDITFQVNVVTGNAADLGNLSRRPTEEGYTESLKSGVIDISTATELPFTFTCRFADSTPPRFVGDYPLFEVLDESGTIHVQLNRPGIVYYVVAPIGYITTRGPVSDPVEINANNSLALGVPQMEESGLLSTTEVFNVVSPTRFNITEPTYSNTSIIVGSPVEVGTGAVEIPIQGLKAATDYFAYFILQGAGGGAMSEYAMLYRFRTEDVIRPVIDLTRSHSSVMVTSKGMNADADYILVRMGRSTAPLSEEAGSFGELACLSDAEIAQQPKEYQQIWEDHKEEYRGYSILDAMVTGVSYGNEIIGSVFDLFATQDYKDKMAQFIRTNKGVTAGDIVDNGDLSLVANKGQTVECQNMSAITQYAFLVVARNPQGSSDAFRATYPVIKADDTAPMVKSVTTFLENIHQDPQNMTNVTYDGTVTVVFDEPLYYYESTTYTWRQFDHAGALAVGRDNEKFESIESLLQTESGLMLKRDGTVNQGINTLRFEFSGLRSSGGNCTFMANVLCDQYGNFQKGSDILPAFVISIKITPVLDQYGNVTDATITSTILDEWKAAGYTAT